jgi:hypothetical protein
MRQLSQAESFALDVQESGAIKLGAIRQAIQDAIKRNNGVRSETEAYTINFPDKSCVRLRDDADGFFWEVDQYSADKTSKD